MMKPLDDIVHFLMPNWHSDCRPDPNHPHRRRFTEIYRRKRCMVKNCWLVVGALAAISTSASIILVLGLSMALLSFVLLDETD